MYINDYKWLRLLNVDAKMCLYLHVQSSDCLSWPATEQKHPNLHGVSCGCDWLACTKHGIFTVFCHSDCTRQLYYSRMSCVTVRWICHIFFWSNNCKHQKELAWTLMWVTCRLCMNLRLMPMLPWKKSGRPKKHVCFLPTTWQSGRVTSFERFEVQASAQ